MVMKRGAPASRKNDYCKGGQPRPPILQRASLDGQPAAGANLDQGRWRRSRAAVASSWIGVLVEIAAVAFLEVTQPREIVKHQTGRRPMIDTDLD
jgi:hypothetical protein